MIKRGDVAAYLKKCGQWQTLDQIVARLGERIPRLEAARYFTNRGRRLGQRQKDQGVHRNRLSTDAALQVATGRRELIRDRLRELVRGGVVEARKEGAKFSAYRYRQSGKTVLWAARAGGYRVDVYNGDDHICTYSAGNSRHESQTYVPLRSQNALSAQEVRWAAKRTAAEFAREHNVPASSIYEDADLAAELKEELSPRD